MDDQTKTCEKSIIVVEFALPCLPLIFEPGILFQEKSEQCSSGGVFMPTNFFPGYLLNAKFQQCQINQILRHILKS